MTVDEDALVAYALGVLPPDEIREVERYLEAHPEAEAIVLGHLDALSELVMDLEPAPMPEDAQEMLLARLRAPSAGSRWRWGLGLGMAAKAAAALWLFRPRHPYEVRQQLDAYAAQPGATEEPLVDVNGRIAGDVVRLPDNRLFLALDKPPSEGYVFQGWEVVGEIPRPLGTWDGSTFLTERPLSAGSTLAVTLEPTGGSPRPTGEPLVRIPL